MNLIPYNSSFDINDFFEHFYKPLAHEEALPFFRPRVDINENKDHYKIIADLPGVDKKDLSITFEDGVLSIEASKTSEDIKEDEEHHIICKERQSGKFIRKFSIGNNLKESDISATFKNGVLTLKAPKLHKKSKKPQKIAIY